MEDHLCLEQDVAQASSKMGSRLLFNNVEKQ
jgi:hypothetical protein